MNKWKNKAVYVDEIDYKRLEEKAEEYDVSIDTILEWLIEEFLDKV